MKPMYAALRGVDVPLLYGETYENCSRNVKATTELMAQAGLMVHDLKFGRYINARDHNKTNYTSKKTTYKSKKTKYTSKINKIYVKKDITRALRQSDGNYDTQGVCHTRH